MRRLPPVPSLLHAVAALGVLAFALTPHETRAHAVAGNRVFLATIAVDDPGVSDEADFQFGHMKLPSEGQDGGDTTSVGTWSASFSKAITLNFGISIARTYVESGDEAAKDSWECMAWSSFSVTLCPRKCHTVSTKSALCEHKVHVR